MPGTVDVLSTVPGTFYQEEIMENKSHLKQFTFYTLLNIFGKLSVSLYILVDTFFISNRLGANGLTALNLAIPVFNIILGISLMLGMGGATRYSIFKSRTQGKESNIIFTNTIYLATIFSAIFLFIGLFMSKPLTAALGADQDVFDMTHTYLKVLLLFSPAFIFNGIFNCFVRNDENPRLATNAMVIGSIANIFLDYIFMFPFNMGMFGAIFATCLSPIISMMILLKHKINKKNHFHLIKIKLQRRMTGDTLSLGFPALIAELASGIVMIVFNIIILSLHGNIGVAAYGVISNLSLVVVAIYNGIGQGVQPLVSREYGKENHANVNRFLRYSMITVIIISAVIYCIIFYNTDAIALIFNSEHNMQLQEIAVEGLKVYFTALPFLGFNIVISIFFTSIEKTLPAFLISLLRGFIIIVPMAFFISKLAGMLGVWLSFPITEGIVTVITLVFYVYLSTTNKRKEKEL